MFQSDGSGGVEPQPDIELADQMYPSCVRYGIMSYRRSILGGGWERAGKTSYRTSETASKKKVKFCLESSSDYND